MRYPDTFLAEQSDFALGQPDGVGGQDSIVKEANLVQVFCNPALSVFLELSLLSSSFCDVNID